MRCVIFLVYSHLYNQEEQIVAPFTVCKYTKIPNTNKQNIRKIAEM